MLRYEINKFGASPVSLSDAKEYMKITVSSDDTVITKIIDGATVFAERHCGREIRINTWYAFADFFQTCFEIRKTPIADVDEMSYVVDGAAVVVNPSVYELNRQKLYPILKLSDGQDWPTDGDTVSDLIRISFTSKVDHRSDIIMTALLRHISDLYENRGDDSLTSDPKRGITFYNAVKIPSF